MTLDEYREARAKLLALADTIARCRAQLEREGREMERARLALIDSEGR